MAVTRHNLDTASGYCFQYVQQYLNSVEKIGHSGQGRVKAIIWVLPHTSTYPHTHTVTPTCKHPEPMEY